MASAAARDGSKPPKLSKPSAFALAGHAWGRANVERYLGAAATCADAPGELAAAEVLVVPVRTSAEDAVEVAMGRRSDSYGFVAPPLDIDKWKAYAAAECAVAAGQGVD